MIHLAPTWQGCVRTDVRTIGLGNTVKVCDLSPLCFISKDILFISKNYYTNWLLITYAIIKKKSLNCKIRAWFLFKNRDKKKFKKLYIKKFLCFIIKQVQTFTCNLINPFYKCNIMYTWLGKFSYIFWCLFFNFVFFCVFWYFYV